MKAPRLLELCAGDTLPVVHLEAIRRVRRAMNDAIAAGDWRTIMRLDRLCGQMVERLPSYNLPADKDCGREPCPGYLAELLSVRAFYARLIFEVNQQLRRSLQHKS